jgi:tetratricopeptide (TPR) repeat protein
MNDANQIETLKALKEVARERERPRKGLRLASVRVSPGAYLAVASVLTFSSVMMLRFEEDLFALIALGVAWLVVPALAITDRIEFDGTFIRRRGPAAFLFGLIGGRRKQLSVADFERVDTQAMRTLRRGGRVRYRYRTQIVGKGIEFSFASGGRSYREMVGHLFPLVHDAKLDVRALELRDFLCDPDALNREVQAMQLASIQVLDNAKLDFKLGGKGSREDEASLESFNLPTAADNDRATSLGAMANKLRIAGRLNEAREAFRRALIIIPRDARLIFDFARLLRSQATSMSDAKLLSRSRAALRLAAMRAEGDPHLLSLVGESFLEWGETARAQRSFRKAIELDPSNFRARLGLANLALGEGKLAHVIHHYRDAARAVLEKALAAYAHREGDYYARLNDDDDYLTSELRRINWLHYALRVRRLAARVTNASILIALLIPYVDEALVGICWSLASSSLIAWISSLFAIKLLTKRRTPRSDAV